MLLYRNQFRLTRAVEAPQLVRYTDSGNNASKSCTRNGFATDERYRSRRPAVARCLRLSSGSDYACVLQK